MGSVQNVIIYSRKNLGLAHELGASMDHRDWSVRFEEFSADTHVDELHSHDWRTVIWDDQIFFSKESTARIVGSHRKGQLLSFRTHHISSRELLFPARLLVPGQISSTIGPFLDYILSQEEVLLSAFSLRCSALGEGICQVPVEVVSSELDDLIHWAACFKGAAERREAKNLLVKTLLVNACDGTSESGVALICHLMRFHLADVHEYLVTLGGEFDWVLDVARELLRSNYLSARLQRDSCWAFLVESSFKQGSLALEVEFLKCWEEELEIPTVTYLVHMTRLNARVKDVSSSLVTSESAVLRSSTLLEHVQTQLTKAEVLWSAGCPREGFQIIREIEGNLEDIGGGYADVRAVFCHKAYLVLHDLERNAMSAGYALESIPLFEELGDEIQSLIAKVNLGDALWGLGNLTEAEKYLQGAYDASAASPHVRDIAAICLANVKCELGDRVEAKRLYEEGNRIAREIGHSWDSVYGRIYQAILHHELGEGCGLKMLRMLIHEAQDCHYGYLEALAKSLLIMLSQQTETSPSHKELEDMQVEEGVFPILDVYIYAGRLMRESASKEITDGFLRSIAHCEGIKGRRGYVFEALQIVLDSGRLEPTQVEFAKRWLERFNQKGNLKRNLERCDYKTCEARCCYDGVYLDADEIKALRRVVEDNADVFGHLPEDYIVKGDWIGDSGYKTAVRAHRYKNLDYPEHFSQTRCVFAYTDGACSLEVLARNSGQNPWFFKPRACIGFPLHIKDGHPIPPEDMPNRDSCHVGLSYPGFESFVPCGQYRTKSGHWNETLQDEVSYLRNWLRGGVSNK